MFLFSQARSAAASPRRRGFAERLMAALAINRQRRALADLDDSMLEDLGLTRSEAEAEARRRTWDVPAHWRG